MARRSRRSATAPSPPPEANGQPAGRRVPDHPLVNPDLILAVAMKVKAEGFVPGSVLKEEFGPDGYTQAVAILFRTYRILREARRPWTDGQEVLGYEIADARFSKQQIKKLTELGLDFLPTLVGPQRPRYGDFVDLVVKCRWTLPILGSVPVKDQDEDATNTFERDGRGNLLILRYHQRAMASIALPMVGKEAAVARRIGWSVIRIPSDTPVKIAQHGITQINREGGKGLRNSEKIEDGLDGRDFMFDVTLPTTAINVDEFIRMLKKAGKHVGLSPGRSSGFGDFEVMGIEQ